jgi:kynurenine 3-monooxygenase
MGDKESSRFTVVGVGLGGALMSIYLARAGHEVDVYELRGDPREEEVGGGRSINLALSTRGIAALEKAGIADEILREAIPMPGRMIHSPDGEVAFQPYGKDPSQAILSVSRGGLNLALIRAADRHPGVRIRFHRKCTGFDPDSGRLTFEDTRTGERSTVDGGTVIGADGAFSAIRRRMQHLDRFDYRQDFLDHGYKELTIPPAADGSFRIEKHALHIWPRGRYMMIALPNPDGSFTCTLFWPFEGPASFDALRTETEIESFFRRIFPDAVPVMPTLVPDYLRNPVSSLVTIRCRPWHRKDRVVLIGDACHAVVPFYGQGMNAAFEDCIVLAECLERHAPDRERAFVEYTRLRKVHVDTLADLAIANFIEMRDHVASKRFLWKKKTEKILHRLLPRWYLPLYTMVTFSRIPYADAVRRAESQNRTIRRFLMGAAAVGALIVAALLLGR